MQRTDLQWFDAPFLFDRLTQSLFHYYKSENSV